MEHLLLYALAKWKLHTVNNIQSSHYKVPIFISKMCQHLSHSSCRGILYFFKIRFSGELMMIQFFFQDFGLVILTYYKAFNRVG